MGPGEWESEGARERESRSLGKIYLFLLLPYSLTLPLSRSLALSLSHSPTLKDMTRITEKFEQLRREGRKAFIPYITAGDPDLATTEGLLLALADAGADVIELGVPFSDPMADGPVIQRGSERALRKTIGVADILPVVERVRERSDVPILLFTYFNPLMQFSAADPGAELKRAGVDGVLVTDLIPEEAADFVAGMRRAGLDTVFLVAPTSTDERIKLISGQSTGFIYVVARTGVTGMRESDSAQVRKLVERVRMHSSLPVAVGFGMRGI